MKINMLMVAAALVASPALAQNHDHAAKPSTMPMAGMMADEPNNPYQNAEMDMHHMMMMAKAGDASEKWTRKMIEHHRGAISMPRVALARATDAETKRMAQMTIDMQTRDIEKLQGWLRSHGKPAQ